MNYTFKKNDFRFKYPAFITYFKQIISIYYPVYGKRKSYIYTNNKYPCV